MGAGEEIPRRLNPSSATASARAISCAPASRSPRSWSSSGPSTCSAIRLATPYTDRGWSGPGLASPRSISRCSTRRPPWRRTGSGRCSPGPRRAPRTRTSPTSSLACVPRHRSRWSPRSSGPTRPACRRPPSRSSTTPDAALGRLVEQMRAFWDAAIEPWWPRISAALEAEIAARARALAALGPQAAFTGLHQTVRWEGDTLHVHPTKKAATDVDLADRGLLLVPAVFTWPSVWPRTDPPWDPALVYPPPGTADLWRPDAPRAEALKALLGERRARVLLELDRPECTLQLARRMHVSAGGVNSHLSVLQAGGPRQPAPRGPPRDLHAHGPRRHPRRRLALSGTAQPGSSSLPCRRTISAMSSGGRTLGDQGLGPAESVDAIGDVLSATRTPAPRRDPPARRSGRAARPA